MKVINQYIVYDYFIKPQMLLETEHGWFISTNGGFGQRDMYLEIATKEEAEELIAKTKKRFN